MIKRVDLFPTMDDEVAYVNLTTHCLCEMITAYKTTDTEIQVRDSEFGHVPVYIHYKKIFQNNANGDLVLLP